MTILKGCDFSCVLRFAKLVKFPSSPCMVVTPVPQVHEATHTVRKNGFNDICLQDKSKTNLIRFVHPTNVANVRQICYHICLEEMSDKCDLNLSLYLSLFKGILKQDKYDEK